MNNESVDILRECDAIQIPQGNCVRIPAGTQGRITQALGDSYTIQIPSLGGLFRVAGKDADALGQAPLATDNGSETNREGRAIDDESIWAALKNVYDPEIPVNIVDLGLVYDMTVAGLPTGGSRVSVKMTLTAAGCGMGPSIAMDAKHRIERLPGVTEADVQVVWDPPWNPRMISAEGRARLGMD